LLDDIIGQQELKQSIKVAIDACRYRQDPAMGHILLSGYGGLGKTYVLNSICSELGYYKVITQGNRLSTPASVQNFFIDHCSKARNLGLPAFLIIDEIHEVSIVCQEEFYYPIDHGQVLTKNDPVSLGPFTIAGATTCPEELDEKSLMSRFMYRWRLSEMCDDDILFIINNYLGKEGITSHPEFIIKITHRCRGIPRLAIKYASRVRDYAQYEGRNEIIDQDVIRTFSELGIDDLGLDEQQRKYLTLLYKADKPIGVDTLSSMMDETKPEQVKKLIEPFLWKKGLITSSSRGRELTKAGHAHLMMACAGEI